MLANQATKVDSKVIHRLLSKNSTQFPLHNINLKKFRDKCQNYLQGFTATFVADTSIWQ